MELLKVDSLDVFYGQIQAIKNISFEIKKGEIVSLIGANGAGKTTTLHTISALISSKAGDIFFKGANINKIKAHKLVSMGMAHCPEGRRNFPSLTVLENLELGAYTRTRAEFEEDLEKMFKIFPRLKERKKQLAGTMSGGEQQMLAIARALMSRPELLLLDEPSMGLAPLAVKEIFNVIKEINDFGVTILLVEQNAHQALEISDRAYVLETGEIVLEGNAKDLLENDRIRKAYLGG